MWGGGGGGTRGRSEEDAIRLALPGIQAFATENGGRETLNRFREGEQTGWGSDIEHDISTNQT